MSWTAERVEELKRLALAGKTSRQIGLALGVTRNAVISKLGRVGVKLVMRHGGPRKGSTRKPAIKRPRLMQALIIEPLTDASQIPIGQRKMLMELTSESCRWPIFGEGADTVFCGGAVAHDRPYCPGHCLIAYEPPKARGPVYPVMQREAV